MKPIRILPWAIAAALMGCAAVEVVEGGEESAPQGPLKAGATAPAFTATDDAGKSHTLASLTEKGPVFLYFVKEFCSSNPSSVPEFRKIHAAYKDKANFVGVINATADAATKWKAENKVEFPILADPDLKIIKGFGLTRSQYTFQVGKDGKVIEAYPGWGQNALNPVNVALAKSVEAEVAKLDFSEAPSGTSFG